jgi:hypothetical protein
MVARTPLTPVQVLGVGAAVLADRAVGVQWKMLEYRYGRSRVQLWRYVRAAMTADISAATDDETLLLDDETHPL